MIVFFFLSVFEFDYLELFNSSTTIPVRMYPCRHVVRGIVIFGELEVSSRTYITLPYINSTRKIIRGVVGVWKTTPLPSILDKNSPIGMGLKDLQIYIFIFIFRRRFIFDILKHIRLPLVATKLLDSYVDACNDISLKVNHLSLSNKNEE